MSGARRGWAHLVVLSLVLPLALSTSLPMFARALAGPAPHICHCAVRGGHSTCACPLCHPGREDLRFSPASVRGQCGDEDLVFGATSATAMPAPPAVRVLGATVSWGRVVARPSRGPTLFLKPPTPPPRLPS